ncbi:MAG TPA: hypothetical protein V6D27_00975 [Vampirovibrionales bacterium]
MNYYLIDLSAITDPTTAPTWTQKEVDALANRLIASGGLIRPIILRQIPRTVDQYELVEGAFELAAARRAQRSYPREFEMIAAIVIEDAEVENAKAQLKALTPRSTRKAAPPAQIDDATFESAFKSHYFEDRKRQSMRGCYVMREGELLASFGAKHPEWATYEIRPAYERLIERGVISRVRGRDDWNLQWVD